MTNRNPQLGHLDLRVVETPPRYPPFLGGVENVSQAVSSRLVARGDDVLVVCADEPRTGDDTRDGVRIRRLPWLFKIANTNITLRLPFVLARADWDVVSTHLPTPWSADWSLVIAKALGRGSVLSFHNSIVGTGWNQVLARVYRSTLFPVLLKLADRIIVLSDYWADEIVSVVPSARDRLRIVRNGVDLERFSVGAGGDGTRLLFVGILDAFHRYKGLDDLLHAVALLKRPFQLAVVGEGSLRGEYEQLAQQLHISDKVQFFGHVDSHALVAAYQGSDIYILPSKVAGQEGGFTLTALEAMATARPVILADGVGQLAREAEAFGAGVRVPAQDAIALSLALDTLLKDEGLRFRMGAAARAYVEENHSWDAIVAKRREIYLEAANLASRRHSRSRRLIGRLRRFFTGNAFMCYPTTRH